MRQTCPKLTIVLCLRIFERGECHFNDLFKTESVTTFESNIAYVLRFMIDAKVRLIPKLIIVSRAEVDIVYRLWA